MSTTRASPPTRRIIAVLELLAAQPGQRLNLTAISRSADVSPATCLGILNELTRADWVTRFPDSTYGLGSGLITLGAAARETRPGLRQARRELQELHGELGLLCTASAVVGEQIVVLDAVGEPDSQAPLVGSGSVFPFVAPVGLMFAAWSPDDEVDAWLARSPVTIDRSKLARLRAVIAAARDAGHLVERLTNEERHLHEYLSPGAGGPPEQAARQALSLALSIFVDRDYAPGELEAAGQGSVSVLVGPCFGPGGQPELYIGLYVMREDVPHAEVEALAARVRASCQRVTEAIGGHDPWAA